MYCKHLEKTNYRATISHYTGMMQHMMPKLTDIGLGIHNNNGYKNKVSMVSWHSKSENRALLNSLNIILPFSIAPTTVSLVP
jgi:hypothetical protein